MHAANENESCALSNRDAPSQRRSAIWVFGIVLSMSGVFAMVAWGLRTKPMDNPLPVNEDSTRLSELPDDIYSISVGRMTAMVKRKTAVIVDARRPKRFEAGHIPGAINIPARGRSSSLPSELEKIKLVMPFVVYCESETCDDSHRVAEWLRQAGVTQIFVFEGGWEVWTAHVSDFNQANGL